MLIGRKNAKSPPSGVTMAQMIFTNNQSIRWKLAFFSSFQSHSNPIPIPFQSHSNPIPISFQSHSDGPDPSKNPFLPKDRPGWIGADWDRSCAGAPLGLQGCRRAEDSIRRSVERNNKHNFLKTNSYYYCDGQRASYLR